MLNIYDGNLNVLLKTIEDRYFEMNDRRKVYKMKNYVERPARRPKQLTKQQIEERAEQDALNDKHIKEHIEFNKRNGFYKDMPKVETIENQIGRHCLIYILIIANQRRYHICIIYTIIPEYLPH